MAVERFDVYLVNLDPTIGAEIQKTRPCLIISPDEMNQFIQTVIIAPMTTKSRSYPSRIHCIFNKTDNFVVLDQIRTVDKRRLIKRLGQLDESTQEQVLDVLAEMFSK